MATRIITKNGTGAPTGGTADNELAPGELGLDTNGLKIYANVGGVTIKEVGAGGALHRSGGTMSGDIGFSGAAGIDMSNNDITNVGSIAFHDGDATITEVEDDDDMTDDSATKICTQQSIKAYVDNKKYPFSFECGGYKTSNSSTTNYYIPGYAASAYYPWTTARTLAQMESLSYTYTRSAAWHAPSSGTIDRIHVTGYATGSDPFKIHIFKAARNQSSDTTITTSQLVESDGISPPSVPTEFFDEITTFSSGNAFAEGDIFWVAMKKTASTASKHYYFSITVSGMREA